MAIKIGAARDVAPGEKWAFTEHRTQLQIIAPDYCCGYPGCERTWRDGGLININYSPHRRHLVGVELRCPVHLRC